MLNPLKPSVMARTNAWGRIAIGTSLMLAPARAGQGWIGPDAARPATGVYSRALGVRDAALGIATLLALGRHSARPALLACAVIDATDFVATLLARDELPDPGRSIALATAGGAAIQDLWLASQLD